MVGFALGLVTGFTLGVLAMAMLVAAGRRPPS